MVLQPFYYLFDLPEGRNLGYLLVQRIGTRGVEGALIEALHDPFVRRFPNERLRMTPLISEKLVQEMEKNKEVSEVKFVRHSVPRDLTTVIGPAGTEQTTGTMDLVFRIREHNVAVAAIRRFVDSHRGTDNILELEKTRFPWDNVKIKVKSNGKERTMDLGDPNRLRASYDVTDQMEWQSSGYPTFDSISKAAREILSGLKSEPRRKSP